MSGANPGGATPSSLMGAIGACRGQLFAVGAFSGVVNLLQLTVSIYMMLLFDRVLATRNTDTLLYLTLVALFALAILALLDALRSLIMQRVGTWVEGSTAVETFSRAIENELRGHPYRMDALRDLTTCRNYLGSSGLLALYDVPWVPIYLAVIFALHPLIGFVALGGALLLFALTVVSEITTSRLLREANVAANQSHRRAEAISRNAQVIDSMGMAPAVIASWRAGALAAIPPQIKATDRAAVLLAMTKLTRLVLQIAVLGLATWLVLQQQLTAGASIAASIIMARALSPVEQLIGSWQQLVQARQSFRRLQGLLTARRLRPPGMPLPTPEGRLVVERLSFGFPAQGVALIKGVSFHIQPGEGLAIIGPSAAGKTTLIRLLTGTLAPSVGSVRLDGANVFHWDREDFGRHVGYLPQGVELFDDTVRRNIARMVDAPPEAVVAAAKLVGCHEMILRLPKGYDTEIGDGGHYLSGGQSQLIGLARAVFGQPRLVILDEPNSNLDGDSEDRLIRGLEVLKQRGVTVVLVSHRPSLLKCVDKVLMLNDGAVEAFGPTAEILKRLGSAPRPVPVPDAAIAQERSA